MSSSSVDRVADRMAARLVLDGLLPEIYRVVEAAYPEEGCGFVFESPADELHVIPTTNRATLLHEKDPETYPRDGRDYFEPDMKPWLRAERAGHQPRVIFHSHPDTDAYFSETDRRSALIENEGPIVERHPGVVHLVVSVRDVPAAAQGSRLFRYDPSRHDFVCVAAYDAEASRLPNPTGSDRIRLVG